MEKETKAALTTKLECFTSCDVSFTWAGFIMLLIGRKCSELLSNYSHSKKWVIDICRSVNGRKKNCPAWKEHGHYFRFRQLIDSPQIIGVHVHGE